MTIKKKNQNEKGFAMLTVLIVLFVLMILLNAVIQLADNNTKQVRVQEEQMQAYYIAKSGIEIAYAALMDNNEENMKKLIANKTDILSQKDLKLPSDPVSSVSIEVKIVNHEVRISSEGSIEDSNIKTKLVLYIDENDFNKTRWGRE